MNDQVVRKPTYTLSSHLERQPKLMHHSPVQPSEAMAARASGNILRVGVIISALIILSGMLLLLATPGGLNGQTTSILSQSWLGSLLGNPQTIIMLGLIALVLTPVCSVIASAVAFARAKDRIYTLIALAVLSILITSFLLGRGGA